MRIILQGKQCSLHGIVWFLLVLVLVLLSSSSSYYYCYQYQFITASIQLGAWRTYSANPACAKGGSEMGTT